LRAHKNNQNSNQLEQSTLWTSKCWKCLT